MYQKIQFRRSNEFRTHVVELSENGEMAMIINALQVAGYTAVTLSHPKA